MGPAQHGDLMAQHEQLGVLGCRLAEALTRKGVIPLAT
jgi:hypothetical protein